MARGLTKVDFHTGQYQTGCGVFFLSCDRHLCKILSDEDTSKTTSGDPSVKPAAWTRAIFSWFATSAFMRTGSGVKGA